jgi:hypothetical protein
MHTVVVYSPVISNRLTYVLDWLLTGRLQLSYRLTSNIEEATRTPFGIIYGQPLTGSISIPEEGLMHARAKATTLATLPPVLPTVGEWISIPTLFATEDNAYSIPFDIFSAIFYLLSRYEEYLPYTPDKHGRYPATESILFRNGWLERPLVDEWVTAFHRLLEANWDITITPPAFSFTPSYDIDMAYSHAYKGFKRIIGAYIKALLKGDVEQITHRTQVLKKKVTDPYDSFAWIRHQHEASQLSPLYFILCALRTTPFDRNIHPRHPAMIRVIKQLAKEGHVGIHPSYYATHYDQVAKEKSTLQGVTGKSVHISRQHYIRLILPTTYQVLMDNDITDDYSMGYGTHIGFRAGTGASFPWYDLQQETVAPIRIHPFCFMDTTAHFDMQLGVEEAFSRLNKMAIALRNNNSALIPVFHNFSLGTDAQWSGWNEAYGKFLAAMSAT